jgi:hypothetical protein
VCVTERGLIPFSLLGSLPTHPEIRMNLGDKLTSSEFSLLLYEPVRHSLLAALPTAFQLDRSLDILAPGYRASRDDRLLRRGR